MANDKKSELLGLNYSSASSALRKQIIFHLAGVLDLLKCYRCGIVVELENFSIEHKDSWMQAEDPKASFFDMNNIAFSHLSCNSGAAYHQKLYVDGKERSREGFRRFYSDPIKRAGWLERKRNRYNSE